MGVPTGAVIETISDGRPAQSSRVILKISGTYTAADFVLGPDDGVGFTPGKVRVLNTATRNETRAYNDGGTDGEVIVAAGGRSWGPHGIDLSEERQIGITVATAGPITDNSTVIVEAEI